MNPLKFLQCCIRGHIVGESIVNTMIPGQNWIRKCEHCGVYLIHGDIGTVVVSERYAMKYRDDYYKEFPFMKPKEVTDDA